MTQTPLSERRRIVLWGRRNAGKSSLMNALVQQEVSIVSAVPGTTTDTVSRAMELIPVGPVALTDTAGIDDEEHLGALRVERSLQALEGADIALWVLPRNAEPLDRERQLLKKLLARNVPVVAVRTFSEEAGPLPISHADLAAEYAVNNPRRMGHRELLEGLAQILSTVAEEPTPLQGLVGKGDLVLLITPVDSAAPRGRLILPQVETIRDALDREAACLVVQERQLSLYRHLYPHVSLAVTDSQAFASVSAELPPQMPLTSFSLLFARKKADLSAMIPSLKALDHLKAGARILIWEACRHHRQEEDIATVKIPRLLQSRFQPDLVWTVSRDWPPTDQLRNYDLIIACGACSITRTRMLGQVQKARDAGVPILNFGLFLAYANGLIPRALQPLGVM